MGAGILLRDTREAAGCVGGLGSGALSLSPQPLCRKNGGQSKRPLELFFIS